LKLLYRTSDVGKKRRKAYTCKQRARKRESESERKRRFYVAKSPQNETATPIAAIKERRGLQQ
jgi:hypothetical protein